MTDGKEKEDPSGLAIGGGTMLGLGAGFFFLKVSVFAFVGCLIGGIGVGLMVSAIIGALKRD